MPDPLSLLRFVALVVFISLVAVGLWLLDVAWWVVPPVMAGALLIAWTIEWVAWRGSVTSSVVRETAAPLPAEASPVQEPASFEPLAPPPPVHAEPTAPPSPHPPPPVPEPPIQPEPSVEPEPPPLPPPPPPAPEPEPEPEPEPVLSSAPEPPPSPPQPVAAAPSPEADEAPRERRRPRRLRLRSVPPPPPALEPAHVAEPAPRSETPSVVEFRPRTVEPRQWNLWDLERIAREGAAEHPERRDEWSYLFLNLRQFATADGSLPTEFDGLVRESFAGLLERSPGV